MGEAVLTIPSRNQSINRSIEPNSDSKLIQKMSRIHARPEDQRQNSQLPHKRLKNF